MTDKPPITIRTTLHPGDIGYIVYLHGLLYAQEYNFGPEFECDMAIGLGEFLRNYDPSKERVWIAELDGRIVGALIIGYVMGEEARVRWVILHPDARGRGLSRQMLNEALAFCQEVGYKSVSLGTLPFLDAARHLYESAGFKKTQEITVNQWGIQNLTLLTYRLDL